jgi:hypothetical protein
LLLVGLVFSYFLLLLHIFYLAGSIAMSDGGITYLESIDSLSKSQIKQLLYGKTKLLDKAVDFFCLFSI